MSEFHRGVSDVFRRVALSVGERPVPLVLKPASASVAAQPMTVRLASNDDERSAASMLLNRMYSRRGYGSNHRLPSHQSSASFSASVGEQVIGTLTLTVDSPDGLSLDRTFVDELSFFRSPDAKICELTKLAFAVNGFSMPYLAALFHIIFIFGTRKHNCTDLFIEVHPRHVKFYQAMLRFTAIGEVKINEQVNAPAQLMWLKIADLRQLIDEHAGNAGGSTRTLYRHFYSPMEECGIYERLFGNDGTHLEITDAITTACQVVPEFAQGTGLTAIL
ncbi:MAG TPA: acetyltransferase [Novosphingobium sp.]|nr:acetyltransferase [Novosphingobium sp.]